MNLKYFFNNLFNSPINFSKELITDFKKDFYFGKNKSQNNKIWICGLPKSGTTMIEQILDYLGYIRMDRSFFRKFPNKNLIQENNLNNYISSFPKKKLSYIKTHLEYKKYLIEELLQNNFKIIVTTRDLRDMMISRFYHVISDKNHWQYETIKSLSKEKGFIKSLYVHNEDVPLVYYYNWVKKWKEIKNEKDILHLNYDNYLKDPYRFINTILKFINLDNKDVKKIETHLNFIRKQDIDSKLYDKLRRPGSNVSTFRSGKPNQWKSFFNKDIESKFHNLLPGKIEDILD